MFFSLKYLLWLFLKITVSNARHGSQATFSYSHLLKTVGGSEVYISRRPSSLSPGFPYFVNQISQKNSGSSIFFFPPVYVMGPKPVIIFLNVHFFLLLILDTVGFCGTTSVNFFNVTIFLCRKCFVL